MNYLTIAKKWRNTQNEPHTISGIVLIWEGQVYGWKDSLRDPNHERPNAIAVDENGRVFRAEGGNDYDGAERWASID
ncbi:TPA: antirestriction protein ArdR [Escherichia coli]|uniref:antirestriction protein ArdR n=1 Tax=Escherichia coli TaxID=562 RepID=UPI000DA51F7D|nr:antirestriction protein ArdR [Escherichia coli]SQY61124.1 Uncharacterised protein [Escherichia coli]HCN5947583.1 antirestriction protein ArdR [Escherichia coli]HCO0054799.1 antirestriction protein ArdR [Escherichia coli]